MAEKQYQRLTWARRRQAGFVVLTYARSSLWLGKDHLLGIDTNGYSESYKRFYFQDIQAVTIRLTPRRLIWNWVLGVPTILCVAGWGYALLLSGGPSLGGIITGVVFSLLFGVPLLINNLRGPTCTCQLRTAVQTEDLPSLCRLRKVRKILDRLQPLIAQAQGQLAPEEIPARMQAWVAATAAASAPAAASTRYVVDDPNLPPRIVS
jgi:hypothetical protein